MIKTDDKWETMCYNFITTFMERMIGMRKFYRYGLGLLLGASLLTGCAAGAENVATLPLTDGTKPVFTAKEETVITNGGALASAIAPGAVVELGELTVDMTEGNLEDTPYCRWETTSDGVQLVVSNADNLTIRGVGADKTGLETGPRSALVLTFENCKNLTLENFSAGHTKQAGPCEGDVLLLRECENVTLRGLGLYGCGYRGIVADSTTGLKVENSDIYSCASTGVSLYNSDQVELKNCKIYSVGEDSQYSGYTALDIIGAGNVTLEKCAITDNKCENLVVAEGAKVTLKDCSLRNNTLNGSGFVTGSEYAAEEGDTGSDGTITLIGCTGEGNQGWQWLPQVGNPQVLGDNGRQLLEAELTQMLGSLKAEVVTPNKPQEEVTVTNMEEFLAAIGSNKKIILDTALLDESTADMSSDGEYYTWDEVFDGKQLTIRNVDNMTITGKIGKNANTLSAAPRYAQVLSFDRCSNIAVENLTAGHTKEPGYCVGGVLLFQKCTNVQVRKCGLYGCGTIGIAATDCRNVTMAQNEIYECSYGGIQLMGVATASMDGNTFRDLGDEYGGFIYQVFSDCSEITMDGKRITPGYEEAYTK